MSSRSLVETNEHLLKELKDVKSKHHHEIEQMHWSYEQLKSTMMLKDMSHYGKDGHSMATTTISEETRNLTSMNSDYHQEGEASVTMY